ncbi:MAG: phosphatase PAP2 family protein [Micromonosporaceae bacterium]|nr:phosphatase PAP2 family protein [Micromonosporaceae bacterium]
MIIRGRGVTRPLGRMGLTLAASAGSAVAVGWFFLHTTIGQCLDAMAYLEADAGSGRIRLVADGVLVVTSIESMLAATAVLCGIAVIRRGVWFAGVIAALIGGANVTTQALKMWLGRTDTVPDGLSTGLLAWRDFNSLPSGHATAAAAVAAGLVFVTPARLRGVGGAVGCGYAAAAAVATVVVGWHRPSDAVASLLVVAAWASAAGIMLAAVGSDGGSCPRRSRVPIILALTGLGLLGVAVIALHRAAQVVEDPLVLLTRAPGWSAYLGSAVGIAGVGAVVLAVIIDLAHRVDAVSSSSSRAPGASQANRGIDNANSELNIS